MRVRRLRIRQGFVLPFLGHAEGAQGHRAGLRGRPGRGIARGGLAARGPGSGVCVYIYIYMEVGQHQWCTIHFRTYLSGEWDVHWEYDLDFDPWPYSVRRQKPLARL